MKKLFMILPLVFLLCFTFGCQEKEAMKAQTEVEEQNKSLVKSMFEALGKGDFEAYKEIVAPEYIWYMPSNSTKPMSRDETIEFEKMVIYFALKIPQRVP